MRVALTGATGFIGRYLVGQLYQAGHSLRCWHRPSSNLGSFDSNWDLQWIEGDLGDHDSADRLVDNCDAVVHAALYRQGAGFMGGEGDLIEFAEINLIGTLQLIQAARRAGASRFVFISTCAVHDEILQDRPLDETHPLWPKSHYGAHKAAIEKFVHSFGLGQGFQICALRPTGVYGVAEPVQQSKWYDMVAKIVGGQTVRCEQGGKEVHATDVAKAAEILLRADGIAGQAYNCYDRYISEFDVATLAKQISGSHSQIIGAPKLPKHEIRTDKLRGHGMRFGGTELLTQTIGQLVADIQRRIG